MTDWLGGVTVSEKSGASVVNDQIGDAVLPAALVDTTCQ
jgi:hypothetical protein